MENYFCGFIVKAFCHAREADIQKYTSAENIFTEIVLHTIHYDNKRDAHTDTLFGSSHSSIDSELF